MSKGQHMGSERASPDPVSVTEKLCNQISLKSSLLCKAGLVGGLNEVIHVR